MNRPEQTDRPRRNWLPRLRIRLSRSIAASGLLLIGALMQAQAPPPPAAPVVTISRSWYFEAAIVAVMFGLALFVVCRSSRRN